MRQPVFRGVGTALVTPFTPSGAVNYDKLAELIDWQIDQDVDALVILGTTGESPTIPTEEHIEVIARSVDLVRGRVPLIAGAGSNSTAEAIYQTQACTDAGADAILSVTPYYNKTTQAGMIAHFQAIAAVTELPIIVYNGPSRTGMNIDPATAAELSKVDNIVGVKECNFDQIAQMKTLVEPDFQLYSGEDGQVIPMLSWGGLGVISVMSNVVPKTTHELVQRWFDGDQDRALEIQLSLIPLIKALFAETNPIPVKEAMNLLGWQVGAPRLPLVPPSEATRQLLAQALHDYGVTGTHQAV
ncbi:MAG: 4-hydroxy-tetrahydrodipicolinate synthase [Propionibacteriaceae bacterium]|jgi:4-hydroxy-tetrahydrodipicolinate synthase|nr:4-hydroxy-tetrahydrodipicolinate synthase [Propionibacteriaceae bacterium]